MSKRIEIEKFDDGETDVLDGCTIEEFNKGGGMVISSIGHPPDGVISFSIRMSNKLTNREEVYRIRFDVSPDEDLDEKTRTIAHSLCKSCSLLMGKEGFVYGNSSTYEQYEDDYLERHMSSKQKGFGSKTNKGERDGEVA